MGLQPSRVKGDARLSEICEEERRLFKVEMALLRLQAAEKAAGTPAVPGSAQAQYQAFTDYKSQLAAEKQAIYACQGGCLAERPRCLDTTPHSPVRTHGGCRLPG